ncbi:lactonase family protein [Psychromonas ossibalaenae]|uniref:lactonase family protein n=1 Tax=Psychromonas ossibalaenae TaxID=444922 RepID=UPI00037DBB37|nr:lactonase family protein [Psychromonas ossibalaenae]
MSTEIFYLGCYTAQNNPGIKVIELDNQNGALTVINELYDVKNASFLTVSRDKSKLLAVSEDEVKGKFACFDLSNKRAPVFINSQSSLGGAPCHISQTERQAFVANYASGNLTAFSLSEPSLTAAYTEVQHYGYGADPLRQASAHIHASIVCKNEKFLISADLGIDQLKVYGLDCYSLTLLHSINLPAGAGPRHLCFNPQGDKLYLGNELNNKVSVFDFDLQTGGLTELQSISSLPADFSAVSYIGEVQLSADGCFLYVSNRGHDSITVFTVDQNSGLISKVDFTGTKGKFPRHFSISPDQNWLLAANQHSGNVLVFKRNLQTGLLTATEHYLQALEPVCICF